MDNINKAVLSIVEELAKSAVSFNPRSKEEITVLIKQLKNIQALSREQGIGPVDGAVNLLLGLVYSLDAIGADNFLKALFCWISNIQNSLGGGSEATRASLDKLTQSIKEQFIKIIGEQKWKKLEQVSFYFNPIVPGAAFEPTVPNIDLSDGPAIILEFITEAHDHLESAENSLLNLENVSDKPEEINKIFRGFHTIKGVSSFLNLEDMRILSHDVEAMMDFVRKDALTLDERIINTIFSAIDTLRKLLDLLKEQVLNNGVLKLPYYDISPVIKKIREIISPLTGMEKKKLGEILVNKEIVTEAELTDALKQQQIERDKKIGEILVGKGAATKSQVERGLAEQSEISSTGETVKISVKKLDDLVDVMGELVITGTQVIHHPDIAGFQDTRLRKDISQLDRIIRDIQNISMAVRLVPIRPIFQKMSRVLRDLSKKSGKNIEIKISGEGTEIDKNIIELISDPLMHMVRNAVDHGIEEKDIRKSKGKPECAEVKLCAYHKGGNIVIEVSDDGKGLDKGKILKRAIELNLAKEDEVLSDDKIYRFIFEPGFSTADKVTDISGRGVGMDVVKRNIEQLQGRVELETEQGKGSKFLIRMPLTLAIIEGIIVRIGTERYILPIFSVEEFIHLRRENITTVTGKGELIKIHSNLFPIIRLDKYFNVRYKKSDIEELVGCLANSDYGRVCLLVDELIGQQQIVIKNLGGYLKDVKGLAGATILGDGRVGLIIDINSIALLAKA